MAKNCKQTTVDNVVMIKIYSEDPNFLFLSE